jgi:transposase-like protein
MEAQEIQGTRRSQRDYSLAFKLQVVSEVEKGEVSYKQAQRKYGIHATKNKIKEMEEINLERIFFRGQFLM